MSNRFDSGSVSAYTPQSFQELSFTPMMKRAQHDEMSKNLTQLDAIATDPLNEHRDEALKLKQEFEGKLGNISGELASKGIDGIGRENFYRLKKEHDDLIAPTGKIGQINAAKVAEANSYKKFLESDDAKSNSQEINLANWNKFRNQYTGYSDPEKKQITNIGDLGAVRYIDEQKMLSDAKSDLGMNEQSFKNVSSMLNDTGNNNGTRFTVDTSKAGSTGSNYEQVKAMADYFNKRITDKSDPFRKSLEYTGRDLNKVWDQMSSHMGMMKKYQKSNESTRSYSDVDYYDPKKDKTSQEDLSYDGVVDPQSTKTIGEKSGTYDFSDIGSPKFDTTGNSTYDLSMGSNQKGNGNNSYKDIITDPTEQLRYEVVYNRLIKNKQIKPTSKGLNDSENAKIVGREMTLNGPITISSKIMRADIDPNDKMFMGKKLAGAKDGGARNKLISTELAAGGRDILDPRTGKKISSKDFNDNYTAEYYGYDAPQNIRGYNFGKGIEQTVMSHKVILRDKKTGELIGVAPVSRTREELDDPNFKAATRVTKAFRNMIVDPNNFTPLTRDQTNKDYKGIEINYVTKDNQGNQIEPYVLVKHPNGEIENPKSLGQWQKEIMNFELSKK